MNGSILCKAHCVLHPVFLFISFQLDTCGVTQDFVVSRAVFMMTSFIATDFADELI